MADVLTRAGKGSPLTQGEMDDNWEWGVCNTTTGTTLPLTQAMNRTVQEFTGTSATTWTVLGSGSLSPDTGDWVVLIKNNGTVNITLDLTTGTDTLDGITDGEATIGPNSSAILAWDGSTGFMLFPDNGVPYITEDSTTTLTLKHRNAIVRSSTSGGNVTLTLPAVATAKAGYAVTVICTDATNTLKVEANGTETINVAESNSDYITLPAVDNRVKLVCNGTNWDLLEDVRTFHCHAYLNTTTTYTSNDTIEFDTESFDIGDCFNTTTHTFTVPEGAAGLWHVRLSAYTSTGLGSEAFIRPQIVPSSGLAAYSTVFQGATNNDDVQAIAESHYKFTDLDTVTGRINIGQGDSSCDILGNKFYTYVECVRIR